MGVKKVTIETYCCDRKGCNNETDIKGDFYVDVPLQLGTGRKGKLVLCVPCMKALDAFRDGFIDGVTPSAAKESADYDPQADPRMQKLKPEDRTKHHKAKVWAMGPESTVRSMDKPTGVRGPAGLKVLTAYEVYLEEERRKDAADAAK